MPGNSVAYYLWPKANRAARLRLEDCRKSTYHVNDALGDWVKVVIMRSAGSRIQRLAGAESLELV